MNIFIPYHEDYLLMRKVFSSHQPTAGELLKIITVLFSISSGLKICVIFKLSEFYKLNLQPKIYTG